tara:strand:- start:42 stop:464 length:423 start_codon:yes stop_codon:yes gene_type:complete
MADKNTDYSSIPNLSRVIRYAYPTAKMMSDFKVMSTIGVVNIILWNTEKLGAQPEVAYLQTQVVDSTIFWGKEYCKAEAEQLLAASDWSELKDVVDPTNTPYLTNASEWTTYRVALRVYVATPVDNPSWPTKPSATWSTD